MNYQITPHFASENFRDIIDFRYPPTCSICGWKNETPEKVGPFLNHVIEHSRGRRERMSDGGIFTIDIAVVCPCGYEASTTVSRSGMNDVLAFNRSSCLDAHLRSFGTHEAINHHLQEAVIIQAANGE